MPILSKQGKVNIANDMGSHLKYLNDDIVLSLYFSCIIQNAFNSEAFFFFEGARESHLAQALQSGISPGGVQGTHHMDAGINMGWPQQGKCLTRCTISLAGQLRR